MIPSTCRSQNHSYRTTSPQEPSCNQAQEERAVFLLEERGAMEALEQSSVQWALCRAPADTEDTA